MGSQIPDGSSIYFYNPSLGACILFIVLYLVPAVVLLWQTCLRFRTWYFLCVPIGACLEVGGYIARAYSVKHVSDIPPYAVSSSLIVIAPLFIAAGNYLLIGRLILSVLPPSSCKFFGLPPTRITKVFVGCDILSFLIQASGSGIASSGNWKGNQKDIGVNVLIAGLASQLLTTFVFMGIVGRFARRAFWQGRVKTDAPVGWEKVLKGIFVSIFLITIRSVYRLIEFALGIEGYPFNHEWVFYLFESLPMLPAIAVFCVWYPGNYLPKTKPGDDEETNQEMT